jgi:nucleoside-diphosphate-sugar epimerase
MDDPVLVTGASGFFGRALCDVLARRNVKVIGAVRREQPPHPGIEHAIVEPLGPKTDWRAALSGVKAVVHTAARVHQMQDRSSDPLAEFRRANVQGTRRLAEQASEAGVRRLIFISSVKVMGGERERPYTEADQPSPTDAYGISKWEAEQALASVGARTGLQIVTLRPPRLYGPGVKANMLALVKAIARGIPLPLGAVHNRRSLLYVGNLVAATIACLEHPSAASHAYLVSDGEDRSTAELVRRIALQLGRRPRLIGVPLPILRGAGRLLGKRAAMDRLLGSLTVDASSLRHDLDWSPPFSVDTGLADLVRWLRNDHVRDAS